MIDLIVLTIILACLALLLLLPVGIDAGYDASGFRAFVRLGAITVPVFPQNEKSPRKKKEKRTKKVKKRKTEQPTVTKDEVLDGAEAVVRAVKKLRFHLRKLKLHFVSAFDDPYRTAMVYGYASAAVHGLGLSALKQGDVQLAVDFERGSCYVDGYLSVTIRIYYIVKLIVCLIGGALPILWRRRKRLKNIEQNTTLKGKKAA